ncbi:MAG TPA: TolC family protein [Prolixibacteraceae bacterium]|nr:TolC family protein [Prolixibacteraceae bacterium]
MNLFSNKYRNRQCFLFLIGFLIPAFLCGQGTLSLEEALEEGMMNNFRIRIARNNAEIARKNLTYGNAGFLPVVSAYGSMDRAFLNAHVEVASGSELNSPDAEASITSAGIKADWLLFDGTGMFTRYEKLKTFWRMSDLETQIALEKMVQDIIVLYADIIRQTALLKACRHRLDVSNFRLGVARQKHNSGMGSEQEYLQAAVTRQADSTEWIRQVTELGQTKIRLNQLTAVDIRRDFQTEDSLLFSVIPEVDELLKTGLEENNLMKLQNEQYKISELNVRSLGAERYPKLHLTGSYSYYENDTEASFIKYNRYFGPQFGLTLGMKLFDGFQLNRSLQNARLQVQNEELRSRDLRQEVSALIMSTWLEYQSSLQSIALGKERLNLAARNLEIATEAYRTGALSSLGLREAQDGLFQARAGLANAFYHAKVEETLLLAVCGLLIP